MTTAVQQRVKMKNLDVAIGAVVAGFSLAQLNVLIGIICGTITAGILALQDAALAARLDAWRDALSASIPDEPKDD